jgi:hypothetical protein
MNEASIPTTELLRQLGFQPDSRVLSDTGPGLSFDFGNFTLNASQCLNLRCIEVVLFSGVLAAAGSLAEVFFELPPQMTSLKQCAAWIVWNLDQRAPHRLFIPGQRVGWIIEGRESKHLLPWVLPMAEYEARPKCVVRRDWLRLALKTLAEDLAGQPHDAVVVFSFDGLVLYIRYADKAVALPGEGTPWTVRFQVRARALQRRPKRFMMERLEVSVWESRISLGSSSYDGTIEPAGTDLHTQIQ